MNNWKTKDSARQAYDSQRKLVLVEPASFMNNSGVPVRLISSWYRTPPEGVLVITDDLDIPFGTLRMRATGGHGGHNGLRSIIGTIGDGFPRIRIGIGRSGFDAIDQVLGTFDPEESRELPRVIAAAADGVEKWLNDRIDLAMQFVNTSKPLETGT